MPTVMPTVRTRDQAARPARRPRRPARRGLEIVTGERAKRQLPDSQCGLAALTMQASFAAGDLTGGLVTGIQQLGEHAHQLPMLHTENAPEHNL